MKQYFERYYGGWSEDSVWMTNTPGKTAKSIYFYLQEAGYFKTKPPYFTERASLSSFLVIYTLSGEGRLIYEGREHRATAGQCYFINCMNHHYYETAPGCEWEFLWFHFNGSNALGYYEEFARSGFEVVPIDESLGFEERMRRLIAINQERTNTTDVMTSQLIHGLVTELIIRNTALGAPPLPMPRYIKDVVMYIEVHFSRALTLELLAKRVNVSKYHLSREFKRYTGMTLKEYVIITRLTYAKELLKYSEYSVGQIAERCGVDNVSHFINLFKAREGCTPYVYRKGWKSRF